MNNNVGVILLDGSQVVMRVYQRITSGWKLIDSRSRNWTKPENRQTLFADELVEEILRFLIYSGEFEIDEWKFIARHLPRKIIEEVGAITDLEIENLALSREQELLCLGMVVEGDKEGHSSGGTVPPESVRFIGL